MANGHQGPNYAQDYEVKGVSSDQKLLAQDVADMALILLSVLLNAGWKVDGEPTNKLREIRARWDK